ncbi:MAG: hypothetical protein IJ840_04015 [Bacteroidales bacterium]|nr:hypothetical protein [Bacteroidales bacterium]
MATILQSLNARILTVHQSKGLECDYIILLNCNGGTIGFPSQIRDSLVQASLKQSFARSAIVAVLRL